MAGDAKQVEIGENKERIEDVVDKLVAQSSSTKTKSYEAGTHRRTMADQKFSKHLLGTLNRLRRFENWCIDIDGGQPGVFHRYLFAPVANAAAEFRNANNRYQKALAKIVEERSDWMQPTEIHYAYGDYTFTTKAELMGRSFTRATPRIRPSCWLADEATAIDGVASVRAPMERNSSTSRLGTTSLTA